MQPLLGMRESIVFQTVKALVVVGVRMSDFLVN
jgi:hypothetical protein